MLLGHEDKLLSPLRVNDLGLLNNSFQWMGSIACRSLITMIIIVQYALRHTTPSIKFSYDIILKKKKKFQKTI